MKCVGLFSFKVFDYFFEKVASTARSYKNKMTVYESLGELHVASTARSYKNTLAEKRQIIGKLNDLSEVCKP